MKKKTSRRKFMKQTSAGAVGLSFALSAKSYANILGANDRVNFGAVGVRSRGKALVNAVKGVKNAQVSAICDVDKREFDVTGQLVQDLFGKKAGTYVDIRKMLESQDVDAILIATPEHWHAPMALMGMEAGKHVYVEKPCSHNPAEGEMLIKGRDKYKKIIQMGNQQRSALTSQQAIKEIKEGIIGDVYYCKAWYANNRKSIGNGKKVSVPDWLDWELWQGPAPREAYRDNIVHYNWHWFWNWGTGEVNNNGTHEIDICRWAMGVDFPQSVVSSGGRLHFQEDDWEFYDTQIVNYEFDDGKTITWEGRSCNSMLVNGLGRGSTIHGTKGSIMLNRNSYILYDNDRNEIKRVDEKEQSATTDTRGDGFLDVLHMRNFVGAIREGEKQNSPIHEGHITNTLCHLANYSQNVGRKLQVDAENGRILNDEEAKQYWSRDYEPGWEMKV